MEDIALLGLGIRSDEVDTANRRLDRFDQGAGRADRATDRLRRSSLLLTRAMGALGVALGAAFSLRSVFAFQDAIAEVSTLVDTASFDMKALSNSALEQAAAFGNVQGQVKAYYQIISAGAGTLAEATEILEASNRLAIGGVTDIATAADGLTSVLNAYGDRVESATAVSDALFVAMRAGKTTIGELSAGLGKVAPLAAQTGVSFDELAGAVSALTKGGISTQESITGVRAILAAVAKPTSEATKLANELGLEFNSAALEAKGLSGFLADLVERTGGSTDQLAQLFGGVEALIPAMALAGQAGDSFNQIMDDMADKAGQTEEAFNKMADSPGFQANRLMAAMTAEAIKLGGIIGELLVPTMRFLADNMERVVYYAGAAATFFGGLWVIGIVKARIATMTLSGALVLLRGALIRTGVGALIVLAGELAYQFSELVQRSGGFSEALAEVGRTGADVWRRITLGAQAMGKYLDGVALAIEGAFLRAWGAISEGFAAMVAGMGPAAEMIGLDAGAAAASAKSVHTRAAEREAGSQIAFTQAGDLLDQSLKGPSPADGIGSGTDIEQLTRFRDGVDAVTESLGGGGGGGLSEAAKKAADAYDDLIQNTERAIAAMELEAEAMGLTGVEAQSLINLHELMAEAEATGIELTDERIAQLTVLSERFTDAQLTLEGLHIALENRTPWEVMGEEVEHLNELMTRGKLTSADYWAEMGKAAEVMVGSFAAGANDVIGNLEKITDAMGLQGREAFEVQKALGIARAVVSGGEAIVHSFNAGTAIGGPPLGFAFAGIAAAATAAQIGMIASTSYNSKSMSGAAAGAGAGASAAATPAPVGHNVNVTLQGTSFGREQIRELLEQINDYQADGGTKIVVNPA